MDPLPPLPENVKNCIVRCAQRHLVEPAELLRPGSHSKYSLVIAAKRDALAELRATGRYSLSTLARHFRMSTNGTHYLLKPKRQAPE